MKSDRELLEILKGIPDPREKRGVRYRYADLLLICIYAVLAGYSEGTEIEFYANLNREYFKELLGIEKAPSHDTFSRIMRLTDFDKLSEGLGDWLREQYPDISERIEGKKILHIDGKAVRAAAEKSRGEKPVYVINAMYEGESIGVAAERIGEKENEITKIPEFLERFNLQETIVTVDAIGGCRRVIEAIEKGGGSYVIPVKENQPGFLRTIKERVKELEESGEIKELDFAENVNKGHGRIEKYRLTMIKNTGFVYEKMGAESYLNTVSGIGIIDKRVTEKVRGKEEIKESRTYVITNLEGIDAETLLKIKRSHWNIEAQHWVLDVQLKEDGKTARKGNAVPTAATLRRFCLAVRKHDIEYSGKPAKRFFMANNHDIARIGKLLFEKAYCDM